MGIVLVSMLMFVRLVSIFLSLGLSFWVAFWVFWVALVVLFRVVLSVFSCWVYFGSVVFCVCAMIFSVLFRAFWMIFSVAVARSLIVMVYCRFSSWFGVIFFWGLLE